jgi:hypothetical protein
MIADLLTCQADATILVLLGLSSCIVKELADDLKGFKVCHCLHKHKSSKSTLACKPMKPDDKSGAGS